MKATLQEVVVPLAAGSGQLEDTPTSPNEFGGEIAIRTAVSVRTTQSTLHD